MRALFAVAVAFVILTLPAQSAQYDGFQFPYREKWDVGCNGFWSDCRQPWHLAEDVLAPAGTTVFAPAGGTVKEAQWRNGYAYTVVVEVNTGSEVVCYVIGHMDERLQVKAGDEIMRNDPIGYLAKRGENGGDYDPHFHLGIHKGSYATGLSSCGSEWVYAGYTSCPTIKGDWYNPSEFINSHRYDQIAIGQFPPWGIAGLDAAQVGHKFRDARDAPNRFLDAYRSAGFVNVSMTPYDNDRNEQYEGRYVHWWTVQPPSGVQGPSSSALVQDVKLRAERGNGANVFVREEALLIYNPQTGMTYIVKEGFWGLYMERNGVVTLGAPVGDEELLSNKSIEQHFQRGWCFWDPNTGKLEAYDKSGAVIPKYAVNYVTVGTNGDGAYALDEPEPDPIIPFTGVTLVVMPAEPGHIYRLSRGQEQMTLNLQLNHAGGNAPFTYRFYKGDALIAQGADPFCSATLAPGIHAIRARVEAGSGNTAQSHEVSQQVVVEAAPKSDWGVPFEVRIADITSDGVYLYLSGAWIAGPNSGKGYLGRTSQSSPGQVESFTFSSAFNEILPRDGYLFAATQGGLAVSADRGASWTVVFGGGTAYDIALARGDRFNDWPIRILIGVSGGTPVYHGSWHPREPASFSVQGSIGGFGPYTIATSARNRDEVMIYGSGWGINTRQWLLGNTIYNIGSIQNTGTGRAWDVYATDAEAFVATQRNAGDNVWYNPNWGFKYDWVKVRGIPAGEDVVTFAPINGLGICGLTQTGALYRATNDRTRWEAVPGFKEALGLDIAAGQRALCMQGSGQLVLIGAERGLRVLAAPSAKPVIVAEQAAPAASELLENYPNPFNAETHIRFRTYETQHVRLRVYAITGSLVATLADETMPAGIHTVIWGGSRYGNGVYVCALEANGQRDIRKITLLK